MHHLPFRLLLSIVTIQLDYYSAFPLPNGSPVLNLDVRPTFDSIADVWAK